MDGGDPAECPKCGGYALYFRCHEPDCEDGLVYLDELDPLMYDEDETEPCDTCDGKGHWWVCKSGCAENAA